MSLSTNLTTPRFNRNQYFQRRFPNRFQNNNQNHQPNIVSEELFTYENYDNPQSSNEVFNCVQHEVQNNRNFHEFQLQKQLR